MTLRAAAFEEGLVSSPESAVSRHMPVSKTEPYADQCCCAPDMKRYPGNCGNIGSITSKVSYYAEHAVVSG